LPKLYPFPKSASVRRTACFRFLSFRNTRPIHFFPFSSSHSIESLAGPRLHPVPFWNDQNAPVRSSFIFGRSGCIFVALSAARPRDTSRLLFHLFPLPHCQSRKTLIRSCYFRSDRCTIDPGIFGPRRSKCVFPPKILPEDFRLFLRLTTTDDPPIKCRGSSLRPQIPLSFFLRLDLSSERAF